MNPYLSIIVCTYRRADDLSRLLAALIEQTYEHFEVLIIDGDADSSSVSECLDATPQDVSDRISLRQIGSLPGLTRQRNVGLDHAQGDLIAFFDDDVSFDADFLSQVAAIYSRPAMKRVGGMCGYDVLHYSGSIGWRWRVRKWLGSVSSLEPGSCDHLGRNAPLSSAAPFSGMRTVGWLSGFCMIYRREAIGSSRFDEALPTHGGEDRDFSLKVGEHWSLMMCGDLHVRHHSSPAGRSAGRRRLHEIGFGAGRSFAKRQRNFRDRFTIMRYMLVEFLIDVCGALRHPGWEQVQLPWARLRGILAGYRSLASDSQPRREIATPRSLGQCVGHPSGTSSS